MADYNVGIPHFDNPSQFGPIKEEEAHEVNYSYDQYCTVLCVQAPVKAATGGGGGGGAAAAPGAPNDNHHKVEFANLAVTRYKLKWVDNSFIPPDMHFLETALFTTIYDALIAINVALVHGGYLDQHDLGNIHMPEHFFSPPQRHRLLIPNLLLAPRDTHGLTRNELLDTNHHAQVKVKNNVYEVYCVHVPYDDENNSNDEHNQSGGGGGGDNTRDMYMIKWVKDEYCEKRFSSLTQGGLLWSVEEAQRLALLTMVRQEWFDLVPHQDRISYACKAYFIAMVASHEYVIVWAKKTYCQDPDLIDKTFFTTDFDANEAAELAMTDAAWHVLSPERHDDHYLKHGYPYGLNHDDFFHLYGHQHSG